MNDRELLEKAAMEAVDALHHYDLADTIEECTDDELVAVINGEYDDADDE